MTSSEIYQWMQDPTHLNKSTLFDLKQVVDDFPYFHAARMLYLKNLSILKDVRLGTELKRMSVFVPDRSKLYMLIENEDTAQEPPRPVEVEREVEPEPESVQGLDEKEPMAEEAAEQPSAGSHLAEEPVEEDPPVGQGDEPQQEEAVKKASVPPLSAATTDYANWLETNAEDIPDSDGSKAKLQHEDLIDSFIENENIFRNPRLAANAPSEEKTVENKEKIPEPESLGKDSIDDSYFTETLARVYFRQKRYDKALEIIKALSLKYPEKNIYFADQIRYIEQFINTKK